MKEINVRYKDRDTGVDLRNLPKATLVSGAAYKIATGDPGGECPHSVYAFRDTSVGDVVSWLDQHVGDERYDYVELDVLPNIERNPWGFPIGRGASTWRHRMRNCPRRGR